MIDADALRTGLTREQQELRDGIEADRARLAAADDAGVRAALELRESQLRKVEHALQRHADGTWQQCEDCERPIVDDRFRTVPTTTHCTGCAENHVFWGDTQVISKDALGL